MQKPIGRLFYEIGASHHKKILLALLIIALFLLIPWTTLFARAYYVVEERDPARGSAAVSSDVFGDTFKKVKYVEQGGSPADSLWFYTTTQGSDLLPYDF